MQKIDVKTLYIDNQDHLNLELLNSENGFANEIFEPDLHRPGLALSGFTDVFTYRRIQVFGNTEMGYLKKLSVERRKKALKTVMKFAIPCIIVTESNDVPNEMLEIASNQSIPVMRTNITTTQLLHLLGEYMDITFAETTTVHGSLVDVFGMGVLFTGRSSIGKSEIALDLVERGHRLVADDVVNIFKLAGDVLLGRGSELLQHHMEIRGLGIVDVKSLFGINSIRVQKRIEVEVQLEQWDSKEEYERIGLDEEFATHLGVKIPVVRLPIFPGKNITVIAEVIALNQMLKVYGQNTAKLFSDRLIQKIQAKGEENKGQAEQQSADTFVPNTTRIKRYLRKDYE
ncbi:MAG: HPr kinase/phosphorylase [Deferribacteres bacterium]|nr:HPr kinase/phosphorylase [candidate division KSB1 bacterium]MCB9501000.1 HPr kinase/phosphorylase [Deferribacteres bacterium]